MQYLGGKARSAKYILPHIHRYISQSNGLYVEPFCGGCSILSQVKAPVRCAGDYNRDLILLWQAIQQGWLPPGEVTPAAYAHIRQHGAPAHLKAFIAIGCSWGGKWWGGYARGAAGRSYAKNARGSIARKKKGLDGVQFYPGTYKQFTALQGAVLYLDPPYADTTGYAAVGAFDSFDFWAWANHMARNNHVLVSEYTNAFDWQVLWSKDMRQDMRKASTQTRPEKLMYKGPT